MTARYLTRDRWAQAETRLSERDRCVIQHVAELRFLTGAQATRLCFTDAGDSSAQARAARRALLRLVRLGALARLPRPIGGVRAGSAGFVYCLGLGGQRLAVRHGWQPSVRRRRSRLPGTLFVRHALMVSELHVRLIEADRSRTVELLELVAEPSCWRRYGGAGGQLVTLKPDSFVRLGFQDFEDSYFIEIDRGTEGSRAVTAQLKRYTAYYAGGQEQTERGVFPRVLWLALDRRRVAAIDACAAALPEAERELFQVAGFDRALEVMVPAADTRTDGSPT